MFGKSVFVFSIFLLCSAWIVFGNDDQRKEMSKKFTPEENCSRVGGICVHKESCPPKEISQQGKCPKQAASGAVCCHSLSMTETGCHQLGGHCRNSCPEHIVITRATDCDGGLKCCPLV